MWPVGKIFSEKWVSFMKTWGGTGLYGSEELNHDLIGESVIKGGVRWGQILVRSWLFLWVPLKNFCWNVTGIVTVLRDGTLKRWTGHGSASVLTPSSPEWVPERRNEPHFLPWTLCLLLQHTEKALPNANPCSRVPSLQDYQKWIFLLINYSLWYYLTETENGPGHIVRHLKLQVGERPDSIYVLRRFSLLLCEENVPGQHYPSASP